MRHRSIAWLSAIALATASLVALTTGATAASRERSAFPGENGRIVFDTAFGWWNAGIPSQIYTVMPDGSDLQQLTDMGEGQAAWHPAFSPTASRIVFTYSSDDNNDQIWIMRADGSHQRPLVDEPDWFDASASFTAGGHRVLYTRCGTYVAFYGTCKIVSVRLDGSGARTIIGGTWHPGDAVMSPDGSTIAYASDKGGYESRIWLADADGGNQRVITDPIGFERPMWSPDGTTLVATGYRTGSMYWVRANGTGIEELAPNTLFAAWSPDGLQMVSSVDNLDGSTQLQISATDGSDGVPLVDASLWTGYSDWGVPR
jgi:Tol biopolymer transport system component